MSVLAHFFVVVCGSLFHERLAHFFVDIYIFVSVTYNIAYMQMDIDVVWEDDSSQTDYHTLGLHGRYNSSFQDFRYEDGYLRWKDGAASISIMF